jgi:outer membrane lipoprotein carrier protein
MDQKYHEKHLIKRLAYVACFCLLWLSTLSLASSNPTTALARLLSQYRSYQARFTQQTYFSDGSQPQKSSGRMMMQRPGKFRWEIKQPMQQIVIANGSQLWVYDIALQQATLQKITRERTNPASLLSGDVTSLLKQYVVSIVKFRGRSWYQLKPKSSQASFMLVRMRFSNGRLSGMWLKNNMGQMSQFYFSRIRSNTSLNPSLFIFKPPPGVDVLRS